MVVGFGRRDVGGIGVGMDGAEPETGRADEAETVLWEDLKRNPEHVWNLSLLAKALRMQDKAADAALIDARLMKSSKGGSTW